LRCRNTDKILTPGLMLTLVSGFERRRSDIRSYSTA
jgi:hypothetical protein